MDRREDLTTHKLWTRDFTIITLGSVVSIFGGVLSGFAMSLLVLDYTQSTLYYAIYIALFHIPAIFAPIIGGAVLDRFSRKKTIYTLDFISSGIYLLGSLLIAKGYFNFGILATFVFIIGTIEGVYQVAYESFYPMLISEGNFTKAYAVSSFLETIAAIMMPISTFLYKSIGMAPLLVINSATFFIAACFETRIKQEENYVDLQKNSLSEEQKHESRLKLLIYDLKEGFRYLYKEKGLLAVAIYFGFSALFGGTIEVCVLPYFKGAYSNGEYLYTVVMAAGIIARAVGGLVHYNFKLPKEKKYTIALIVYVTISIIDGTYLYTPIVVMIILCAIEGLLGITSYTIRVSATQSYVPDERKGRFNGAFNVISTIGSLIGELAAGALTTVLPLRGVISAFAIINLFAAFMFIGRNKKHIAPIYNRQE